MKKRLASIGECMLELANLHDQKYQLGIAGDTYNVALYCRRCASPEALQIDYVTALSDDLYSEKMLLTWREECIGTDFVRQIKGRMPGLYLIENDAAGERHMYYYRNEAPVREMFAGDAGDALLNAMQEIDFIYLSGITIAVLLPESREKLYDFLYHKKQQGAVIIFDNNYRERLWSDKIAARREFNKLLEYVNIALPSFDDAKLLFDDASPEDTAKRLSEHGVSEMVIKSSKEGYWLVEDQEIQHVRVKPAENVIDTTCAGDSFNGGYLAKRLTGSSMMDASSFAARLAACVIQHKGAIIPHTAMQAFLSSTPGVAK